MIEEITIQGYKSIKELNSFKLNRLNVLIGANGSGKSNFLSLFELLRNICKKNHQFINIKGGCDRFLHFGRKRTENIYITLDFGISKYGLDLLSTDTRQLIVGYERVYLDPDNKSSYRGISWSSGASNLEESKLQNNTEKNTIFNYIKDFLVYHFCDTGDKSPIKSTPAINDNKIFKQDGANLASYLLMIKNKYPSYYQNIVQTIQLVAPFFHDFELRDNNGYTMLEWYHKDDLDTPLYPSVLSDGTLRFICLTTLLMQPVELIPEIVLIDEPELGLHPYAISVLADLLKRVSITKQIIVSTQSVELINHLAQEDIIVVNQNNGLSTFERLSTEDLKDWLEIYNTIGDIWKSNIIGGRP
jgi:predicted ATPase